MNKRHLLYTVLMMVVIAAIALLLNFFILLPPSGDQMSISQNHVVSVAVYNKGQPYILSFQQQKNLIKQINEGLTNKDISQEKLSALPSNLKIDKISIQRFRQSPIELVPKGRIKDHLVFEVTGLSKPSYFIDQKDEILKYIAQE